MKKVLVTLLVFVMVIGLVGCTKTYSMDRIIEVAREELPVSNADTIDLIYAGSYQYDDREFMWFVSGNEYQDHYYLPMEFLNVDGKYQHIKTYEPRELYDDIEYIIFEDFAYFVINNTACAEVRFLDDDGYSSQQLTDSSFPGTAISTTSTQFLDKDGNVIAEYIIT